MRGFFRSKTFITIMAAVVLCLGIFVYSLVAQGKTTPIANVAGIVIAPLQKGVNSVTSFFGGIYSYIYDYNNLKQENEQLREQVRKLQSEVNQNAAALLENGSLRAMLDLKQKNPSFKLAAAEVIGVDTGTFTTVFTIDRGSVDGIALNNCVMTEDGMVGFVSKVATTYSEVTTVIDVSMQAGAMVARTREPAVAEGNFELMEQGLLKLSYLKKDANVLPGDTVETSGLGGVFPKGIMIGTIEKIVPEDHGVSNYAVVRPAVDFGKVKKVSIITSFEMTE